MTYYDWVKYIKSLEDKPATSEDIAKLNEFSSEYPKDVEVRFVNHIINLMAFKLNDIVARFSSKIYDIGLDHNQLAIEINKVKEEIKGVYLLTSVKSIPTEVKNNLTQEINTYNEKISNILKSSYENVGIPEIELLIKNLDMNS